MMQKNPDDRRARRSRKLLKEGLLALMKNTRFSDISAKNITDLVDMSRATFYLHYADTRELLQSLEDDLIDEAQSLVDEHIHETDGSFSMRPIFEPLLDFIVNRKDTCEVLFNNNEVSGFTERLQKLIYKNGISLVHDRFHPESDEKTYYFLSFITFGMLGLLKTWFDENMAMPKEELITTADELLQSSAKCIFGAC